MASVKRLTEVADFVSGGTPSKSNTDFWGGEIPWVSAKDMKSDFINGSEDHVTSEGARNGTRLLRPGTTIMLVRGMTLHNYVPICFANREITINQDVKGLIPKSLIRPKFLYYSLKALHSTIHQLVDSAGHGTGRLNTDQLRELKLLVPSLDVQDELIRTISLLDDKIELNRKSNETLEQMARAIFKSWFVDFDPVRAKLQRKNPIGLSDATAALFPAALEGSAIGEIPKGWKVQSLYEVANWQNGMTFNSTHFSDAGLPVVKIAELKGEIDSGTKLTDQTHDPKFRIDDRDILFSWSGSPDTSIDTFIWSRGPAWLNQHIFKVTPKLAKTWTYSLLKYFKPVFIEIARNKQTTGLGHVTVGDLKRLNCCVPSADILHSFEKSWSPIVDLIFNNLKESESLCKTRDLLLPRLLSGELIVESKNA